MDPISASGESRAVSLARRVLRIEADAVAALAARVGEDFERAVEIILARRGRVIVTGVGKSGHIGRKMAATLASTGTPAYFVHAAEAAHGDLGMITPEDRRHRAVELRLERGACSPSCRWSSARAHA